MHVIADKCRIVTQGEWGGVCASLYIGLRKVYNQEYEGRKRKWVLPDIICNRESNPPVNMPNRLELTAPL